MSGQQQQEDIATLWQQCLDRLERHVPLEELNTWIRPLQLINGNGNGHKVRLSAPNDLVREQVRTHYLDMVRDFLPITGLIVSRLSSMSAASRSRRRPGLPAAPRPVGAFGLDDRYGFDNFVLGKSNELAFAAAQQVASAGQGLQPAAALRQHRAGQDPPAARRRPLHRANNPDARVMYLHSEKFVSEMIQSLRRNSIDAFKRRYRSVDTLLIDDIQFFAGKDRTQEEFFHTFNALLESRQQIILTCDRYPKEVDGIEARLRSRFGWGLTVSIEPPDFETRVAILQKKAVERGLELDESVAFLVAKRIRSHVRDLEGALNSLIANARFSGRTIDEDYTQEILRDVLAVHDRLITIENIQKTVADFYQLRVADLLSGGAAARLPGRARWRCSWPRS
jgi:chromosomal replication initiator protein